MKLSFLYIADEDFMTQCHFFTFVRAAISFFEYPFLYGYRTQFILKLDSLG